MLLEVRSGIFDVPSSVCFAEAHRRSRSFRLEIVQHPDRTAEFGASTLTRLPLAPPLIAQLVMRDAEERSVVE